MQRSCVSFGRDECSGIGVKEKKERERRASTRKELESRIEFFVNADIISAKLIDISETGLSFDTGEPLKIHLRMDIDGELCDREAQFVRASKNSNGGMTYGFEFIPDPKEYLFWYPFTGQWFSVCHKFDLRASAKNKHTI